jgi:hypothetical protein
MNDNTHDIADWDVLHDTFVAKLTRAAYEVALRHGAAGTWLELELDLWQALADIVTASRFKAIPSEFAIEQSPLMPVTVVEPIRPSRGRKAGDQPGGIP